MLGEINKGERVKEIIRILKDEYPNAGIRLNYSNPLELLIAGILAAQCSDDRVNEVTKHLFKKYKTAKDYAEADIDELMEEIHSTGAFRKKALRIKECCAYLVSKFDGKVPDNMDDLSSISGIGRKTANMVLSGAFGKPGIIVDTHVIRLSERIGLSDKKVADKIEADLMEIVPESDWSLFSHLLAFHGRQICVARKPKCQECKISHLCDYYTRNLKED